MLIVLSGCSGAGKNTVLRELLKVEPGLVYSLSVTTRPHRPGEVHGKDYYFLSEQEFQAARAIGEFLEWAKVYDHYYGTPRRFIEEMAAQHKDVILDIDVTGALTIRAKRPDAVLIFLVPPSLDELQRRLIKRRTDTVAEIAKRLAHADIELESLKSYDYIVVNDDLQMACGQIHSILVAESSAVCRLDLAKLVGSMHGEEEADPGQHD